MAIIPGMYIDKCIKETLQVKDKDNNNDEKKEVFYQLPFVKEKEKILTSSIRKISTIL